MPNLATASSTTRALSAVAAHTVDAVKIYGRGQTWHLTIFALEQKFFDGMLTWKLGRLPVGEDVNSFSCDFQNLNFCGAQPGNIVGNYWFNWPVSQWGTRLRVDLKKVAYVQLAAYEVNPLAR